MRAPASTPAWADRLYTALLRAYPAPFRETYAGEMRASFRDRWHEERESRGPYGIACLGIAVLLDTLFTAARVQGEELARDVRFAWRSLTARPNWSFTAAALLTLALGIGAVTAVFTVVHAVLLAPLPYGEPGRVVSLRDNNLARGIDDFSASMPNFRSWEAARSFSRLAALRGADSNLTQGGEPEHVNGLAVSACFCGRARSAHRTGHGRRAVRGRGPRMLAAGPPRLADQPLPDAARGLGSRPEKCRRPPSGGRRDLVAGLARARGRPHILPGLTFSGG